MAASFTKSEAHMTQMTFARNAMATRFEFVLCGEDRVSLRAAADEAFAEIEGIEAQLSLYRPSSEIAQVNARAAFEPVRVSPSVFELLAEARVLWELTNGLFDITIAPLVRCWGFMGGNGSLPDEISIQAALSLVGMDKVELGERSYTVRFAAPGVMLDLGSIGKGHALDAAASVLRDAGIENALLHGGTSTVCALGVDAQNNPWKIAIENPNNSQEAEEIINVVPLRDKSLSVSAPAGKAFEREGKSYGHVLNPRTGHPVRDAILGCAITGSAAASDALSTAVLLGEETDLAVLRNRRPELRYLKIKSGSEVLSHGIEGP
jgi:thiamine biosynthesis lipoprotein